MLVSIREVFWCRRCPIIYSEKGGIDVQIGRRREASPSMSDLCRISDRIASPPAHGLDNFLLWHGLCMGFCVISERSSIIMRTENAVAAVKPALLPATKPAKGRRVMVEAGDSAGFKHLMGLESVSRNGDAVIEAGGKDIR
ncbi:hypothetical protein [Mesorhizobium sp. M0590]|uniref:hypothetical protein n=1 Tax=Mesorhizobium sp. M0590 TaxID=2956966 RepID=UPI0033372C78